MSTKTIERVVHDAGQERADLRSGDCLAPATPTGKGRVTDREARIKAAHENGADLDAIVRGTHAHPMLLFRILGIDLAENAETYAKLLAEYDGLRAGALK